MCRYKKSKEHALFILWLTEFASSGYRIFSIYLNQIQSLH